MKIDNHLLVKDIIDRKKKVVLVAKETTIETVEKEILVWWKREWHWVNTKHIGDGMQIILLYQRPFVLYNIDTSRLLYGMSVYQEYDENTDAMMTYLYRFTKDQEYHDLINQLLEIYTLKQRIVSTGRFIQLDGLSSSLPPTEQALHELQLGSYQAICSFLFGLLLGYGTIEIDEGVLHGVRLHIPLTGTIVNILPLLEKILEMLCFHGIYQVVTTGEQKQGQLQQWVINDWELLTIFAKRLKPVFGELRVSKHETVKTQKKHLLEWLRKQTPDITLLEHVEYSVLKLVRK